MTCLDRGGARIEVVLHRSANRVEPRVQRHVRSREVRRRRHDARVRFAHVACLGIDDLGRDGDALSAALHARLYEDAQRPCRVYAPVGSHEDLLPYLVRRLLENGANSSFVNRITDEAVAIEDLVRDPVETVSAFESIPHPRIALPVDLYRSQGHERDNSMGINLANDAALGHPGQRLTIGRRIPLTTRRLRHP